MLSFDNYNISFSIPCISPSLLVITTQEDYDLLRERVRKAKNFEANIFVQEKPSAVSKNQKWDHQKENTTDDSSSTSDSDGGDHHKKKKKQKKSQVPKATDIKERNEPVNSNIQALRNRWVCNKKPGCESKFCFVNVADGGNHIPLTFPRLDCWAAAMLKGPAFATLEMPPNHQHFQMVPDELCGQTSILAERRQQLEKAKAAQALAPAPLAATSGPVINFNFPPELLQFLQGPRAQPPAPVSHVTQEVAIAPCSTPMLFSPRQLEFIGDRMTVQEFSSVYNLSDELESKLIKHGYISTHALCYASIEDLESVGLLRGEIAQLHDAVSRWCDSSEQRG